MNGSPPQTRIPGGNPDGSDASPPAVIRKPATPLILDGKPTPPPVLPFPEPVRGPSPLAHKLAAAMLANGRGCVSAKKLAATVGAPARLVRLALRSEFNEALVVLTLDPGTGAPSQRYYGLRPDPTQLQPAR